MSIDQRRDMLFYGKLTANKTGYVAGQLELTSECGQKCIACDSWRAHVKGSIKGTFNWLELKELFTQLNRIPTFEHLTFTGGDPQHWEDQNQHMDLEELLSYVAYKYRFSFQVNTALTKTIKHPAYWQQALKRVRVSLDAATQKTYKLMRGDDRDPQEIVDRMDALAHPGMSTMTCVTDRNIHEIPLILEKLNAMENPPRKAMFLAALNFKTDKYFWEEYEELQRIPSPNVETSFSEDIGAVRKFMLSEESRKLPCYVGGVSFHIKANGDVYPCCLVGGEAIKTIKHMSLGNVKETSLAQIQKEYIPLCHYSISRVCRDVCQWKQLNLNRIAHEASKIFLTMP